MSVPVGQMSSRTNGLQNKWAVEQMNSRTNGLQNKWTVEQMGSRTNGLQNKWDVPIQNHIETSDIWQKR